MEVQSVSQKNGASKDAGKQQQQTNSAKETVHGNVSLQQVTDPVDNDNDDKSLATDNLANESDNGGAGDGGDDENEGRVNGTDDSTTSNPAKPAKTTNATTSGRTAEQRASAKQQPVHSTPDTEKGGPYRLEQPAPVEVDTRPAYKRSRYGHLFD